MVDALALSGPARAEGAAISPAATPTAPGRSLATMVEAHFESVWRFLRRLGVAAADVDDAAQEVILVAARKLHTIAPGSERSFLLGTAFRIARRMNIARARQPVAAEEELDRLVDEADCPESLASLSEERAVLDAILSTMPVDLRAVFVLFEIEDHTMLEISAALGLPPGTVASRLRRAREDFEARLTRVKRAPRPPRGP